MRGADPYQVAVGPIHAGVIESGHFRFHVVGDLILHVDARLFYKHRGLERAAEGLPLDDGLPVSRGRAQAAAVTNSVAYAHACEEALGLVPDAELARARTILLELERVWNTLNDIGAVCAGVGLAAGSSRFAALVEDARRLNARSPGTASCSARSRLAAAPSTSTRRGARRARRSTRIRARVVAGLACAPLQRVVHGSDARHRGRRRRGGEHARVVGPAARAAGVAEDVRTDQPRLAYDGFEAAVASASGG